MKIAPKPRVAFMIPGLGRVRRGVEANVFKLAENLVSDFDVTVYCVSSEKQFIDDQKIKIRTSWAIRNENSLIQLIYNHMPKLINDYFGRYFSYWPMEIECLTFSLSLFPKLLRENFDVLFPVSIWGIMMAKTVRAIKGIKIVHINHGGAEDFIAKQNPDTLQWVRNKHPNIKSVLLPLGIDTQRFSPKVKPVKLSLPRPIFICAAALTSYKRIDLTIRAVGKLKSGSLLVLGAGELEEDLKRLGNKILGREKFLLTSVPYELMPSYFSAGDVFTLVSEGETFALVYLEAMASGLPVVAPNDSRRKFMIGPAGIFCQPSNLDQYAVALAKAAETDFGEKPRKQAEKFAIQTTSQAYSRLMVELVSS